MRYINLRNIIPESFQANGGATGTPQQGLLEHLSRGYWNTSAGATGTPQQGLLEHLSSQNNLLPIPVHST